MGKWRSGSGEQSFYQEYEANVSRDDMSAARLCVQAGMLVCNTRAHLKFNDSKSHHTSHIIRTSYIIYITLHTSHITL